MGRKLKGVIELKKEYLSPEWELNLFSFESILSNQGVKVSFNESGGHDHNDDDEGEW